MELVEYEDGPIDFTCVKCEETFSQYGDNVTPFVDDEDNCYCPSCTYIIENQETCEECGEDLDTQGNCPYGCNDNA